MQNEINLWFNIIIFFMFNIISADIISAIFNYVSPLSALYFSTMSNYILDLCY